MPGFYLCIVPAVPGFCFLGENSGNYVCARGLIAMVLPTVCPRRDFLDEKSVPVISQGWRGGGWHRVIEIGYLNRLIYYGNNCID